MSEIRIKIELEKIDEILETVNFLASAIAHKNGMENTEKALEELRENKSEKPVEEDRKLVSEETEENVAETDNKYTKDEVRKLFVDKNSPSNRNKLKKLLTKYDAKNVSSLDAKHYEAVINELNEM